MNFSVIFPKSRSESILSSEKHRKSNASSTFFPQIQNRGRITAGILRFSNAKRAGTQKPLAHSNSQFSSVAQSCPTLCNPTDCSMPGLPVHHQLPEFILTHVHWVRCSSNHLILCHPLLLPPPIFASLRVFSNESVLHIRWPKYGGFNFNINSSQ